MKVAALRDGHDVSVAPARVVRRTGVPDRRDTRLDNAREPRSQSPAQPFALTGYRGANAHAEPKTAKRAHATAPSPTHLHGSATCSIVNNMPSSAKVARVAVSDEQWRA